MCSSIIRKEILSAVILCFLLLFLSGNPTQLYADTAKDIQGDIDGNFIVNIDDLVLMSEQWLDGVGCIGYPDNCADIYGEDGVNLRDFQILSSNWQVSEIPLFINEVLASNLQTPPENNGEYDDWIEIYNPSDQAIDLAGLYLTDNINIPTKWCFPLGRPFDTTVDPNGFILIWADNPETPPTTGLHASFALDSDGDEVWLIDTDEQTVIDSLEFTKQETDVSYGHEPDASGQLKTLSPTAGSSNNGSFLGVVEDTKFSQDRGFYTDPFDLVITCETADSLIYYTLDASEPDESSTPYTAAITISETSCVRAIAMKAGYKSSNIDTHTYIFIDDVLTQSPDGEKPWDAWPVAGTSVNDQLMDYGVDPDVVNDGTYGPLVDDALLAIPSLSIVTDLDNLFDASTGIYVNALEYGPTWERPTSVELINPDGSKGFQVEAGLRIRGGWSRKDHCPKHSFRLFFRAEYGDSKLKYDLFENEESATEYDKVDLRTAQNYSWSFKTPNQSLKNTFMRDVFSRDMQREMGQPYTRSRFYHLYINGQYWGLYQTQERSEAAYAESYFGGNREDYDVVKADAGPLGTRMAEVTDGTLEEFANLWDLANQFDDADAAGKAILYKRMLGLNPDGSANPNYPVYLDPENLADLMLNVYYVGDSDGPISNFFGNVKLNNFYGIFNRNNPDGFKYFRHDAEHTMDKGIDNRTGPYTVIDEKDNANYFNPQTLHQWLTDYSEYRMLFADRVYQHLFNGGPMTEAAAKAQFDSRKAEIDMAIIAESARWGDAKTDPPLTKADWESAVTTARNFLNNRPSTLLGHLRNKNWYPSIDPPTLLINGMPQYGGAAAVGDELSASNPNGSGTIYYTIDGSDPRLAGGDVNPSALIFGSDPVEQATVLVEMNDASWKYLYDDYDQGTTWRAAGFDDASWNSGPGELGFGDGDEVTDIGPQVDGRMCAYFRHQFNVSDISDVTFLSIDLVYDDGAVIYINDQEMPRVNMPDGDILFDTPSSGTARDYATTNVSNINPSVLLVGDNVIAVEVHQTDTTSSDLSFNLRLKAVLLIGSSEAITLSKSCHVKSRVLDGGQWSALANAVFAVGPVAENLRVSEIMYHPTDPNTEFIELQNIGDDEINLNLVHFTDGIDFTFGDYTLAGGEYVLVVEKQADFEIKYGTGLPIAGQYTGALSNGGEEIVLRDAIDAEIHDFDYKDGWYDITDGDGFSLTIKDADATDPELWDQKAGWRPSAAVDGSPGTDDTGIIPEIGAIVINEILAHSHAIAPDWIELYNTTGSPINIGGWFLSDSGADQYKYEIASGTSIPAGGYIVFYEDTNFGSASSDPGVNTAFALSENGETVYLRSPVGTGYIEEEDFGASETDVAFGRYYKASTDSFNFVAMSEKTPGYNIPPYENAYPKVGPIVINEIMYLPTDVGEDAEFIELLNISGGPVTLYDSDPLVLEPWKITDGFEYSFPSASGSRVTIPAGGYYLLIKDLTAFTSEFGTPTAGKYAVWTDKTLADGGEKVEISLPGDVNGSLERQYIRVDRVSYSDGSHPDGGDPDLWPTSADGGGDSLSRKVSSDYGNDVSNWEAVTPTPGT